MWISRKWMLSLEKKGNLMFYRYLYFHLIWRFIASKNKTHLESCLYFWGINFYHVGLFWIYKKNNTCTFRLLLSCLCLNPMVTTGWSEAGDCWDWTIWSRPHLQSSSPGWVSDGPLVYRLNMCNMTAHTSYCQ